MGQVILSEKTAFLLRSRWITVLKVNKTRDALKTENDMLASYDFLSFFENFPFEIGGHDCSLKLHESLIRRQNSSERQDKSCTEIQWCLRCLKNRKIIRYSLLADLEVKFIILLLLFWTMEAAETCSSFYE